MARSVPLTGFQSFPLLQEAHQGYIYFSFVVLSICPLHHCRGDQLLASFLTEISLCSSGWLQTHDIFTAVLQTLHAPASSSQVCELQVCATMPCSWFDLLIFYSRVFYLSSWPIRVIVAIFINSVRFYTWPNAHRENCGLLFPPMQILQPRKFSFIDVTVLSLS